MYSWYVPNKLLIAHKSRLFFTYNNDSSVNIYPIKSVVYSDKCATLWQHGSQFITPCLKIVTPDKFSFYDEICDSPLARVCRLSLHSLSPGSQGVISRAWDTESPGSHLSPSSSRPPGNGRTLPARLYGTTPSKPPVQQNRRYKMHCLFIVTEIIRVSRYWVSLKCRIFKTSE